MNSTINTCEAVASILKARGFTDFDIYSNLDPSREWAGKPIVELTLGETTATQSLMTTTYETDFVVAVRAESMDVSNRLASRLYAEVENALYRLCNEYKLFDWFIYEERGETPDARGITLGESFYSYLKFKLYRKPKPWL